MKRMLTIAAALLFASGTAFAFHCPKDMKEIDAALAEKGKSLTPAQMKEVKMERAKGEELHKKGDHKASLEHLAKAKEILGIK